MKKKDTTDLRNENLDTVWENLSDIPVDESDNIECDFLHFERGDNKFEIWDWIEEKFDTRISKLLGLD